MHTRFITSAARYYTLLIAGLLLAAAASGQGMSFRDTVATYNLHRIRINNTGMQALGTFGLVSMAGGATAYFASHSQETQYFGEMTALWGVVNTGIAGMGMLRVRRQLHEQLTAQQAYSRYLSDKKLYLINAGLDVVYIGAGLGLAAHAPHAGADQAVYSGFGKAIVVQGVFLLLFDNVMFSAQRLDNSKWFRIINEIRFTGSGIGFAHSF